MDDTRSVTHGIDTTATAQQLYDLVADVTRWPVLFRPTVHVDLLEHDGERERFAIWALAGPSSTVAGWTSSRTFHPAERRIAFRQERSVPPIRRMEGVWSFHDRPGGGSRVELRHDFATLDDDPATVGHLMRVLETNSTSELEGLRRVGELGPALEESLFSFTDTIEVDDAGAAYEFVARADEWPRRLDHVASVTLTEDQPGVQWMVMDTRAPDGSEHTTESVRICEPGRRIVYMQTRTPEVMLGHSGTWEFDGGRLSSSHTVLLDPRAVPDGGLADARERVTAALRANSALTAGAAQRSGAR